MAKLIDRNAACIALFQRRRKRTWRVVRVWLVIGFVSFCTAGWFSPHDGQIQLIDTPAVAAFLLGCFAAMVSIAFIIYATQKYYRCPRCGSVPMDGDLFIGTSGVGYERGVLLNPKSCPKCRAPLA